MQKKFLSNLLLIVFLNLLVKPFYLLGIDAEIQNRVGEVAYGNYFSLLNFSFLLNILLDIGITNYNVRNIAQYPKLVAKHFGKILGIRFLLFFIYALFTLLAGLMIGYNGHEFYLLSFLVLNQFFVAIVQFVRSNFAGLHRFKSDAFISILDRSLLIIICAGLLWTNWFDGVVKIEWFVYAQTIAYGTAAFIALIMIWGQIGKLGIQIKSAFSISILKKSLPYAILILLMMMYNRIDAVMLERLLVDGDKAAGIYAQGFRYLDAVNMFALLFAGLLLPIFSRLLKEKEDLSQMVGLSFRILFGISVIVGIACFLFQNQLIDLRYPESDPVAGITFGWLILSFIPVSMTYVFGTLLTANGSLKYLNIMAFGGFVLNVILNLILIQTHGVEGAAIATLLTQTVTALAQIIIAFRIFKFNLSIAFYLSLAGLVVGLILVAAILSYTERIELFYFLPYLIFGAVLAIFLGVFRVKDLRVVIGKSE